MSRVYRAMWMASALSVALWACGPADDDGNGGDEPGADASAAGSGGGTAGSGGGGAVPGGSGGTGAGGGSAGQTVDLSFRVTDLNLTQPSQIQTILTQLLQSAVDDGTIILMLQLGDWEGSNPRIHGGAADVRQGGDTPEKDDDVLAWLTEGTCLDELGAEAPCVVEVGDLGLTRDGDDFMSTGDGDGILEIYSSELQAIIHIKEIVVAGTASGGELGLELTGAVTEADAGSTFFELVVGNPDTRTSLLEVLQNANVPADTMFEGQPAYTFGGELLGVEVDFEP